MFSKLRSFLFLGSAVLITLFGALLSIQNSVFFVVGTCLSALSTYQFFQLYVISTATEQELEMIEETVDLEELIEAAQGVEVTSLILLMIALTTLLITHLAST